MEKRPFQFGLKTIFGLTAVVVMLVTGWLQWLINAVLVVTAIIGYCVLLCHLMIWLWHGIDVLIRGPQPPEPRP